MKLITVTIVEQDPERQRQLAALLQGQAGLHLMSICADSKQVLQEFERDRPEVVLLRQHPDAGDCIRRIRAASPQSHYLVYGSFETEDEVYEILRAGANGCLLMPTSGEELGGAIVEVCAGGAPLARRMARAVVAYFNRQGEGISNISVREREVLKLLSRGKTSKEIGERLEISSETVRKHLRKVYAKLHVHNRMEAILK
jgi:DNA-binding NarL/FixJ family response regulator